VVSIRASDLRDKKSIRENVSNGIASINSGAISFFDLEVA
jgi:hypothetical protein